MESLWRIMGSEDDAERMMIAIANGWTEGVNAQLAKGITGDTKGESIARGPGLVTMFEFACERGNLEAAKSLRPSTLNIDARDHLGRSPLMRACQALRDVFPTFAEIEPLSPAEIDLREALVRWLVESGADVCAVDEADLSVLHHAAIGCSEALVALMIERGADVEAPKDAKQSALMLAARQANIGALKALVAGGADVNRRCGLKWAEGKTALGVLLLEVSQGFPQPSAVAYLRSVGATV